jgi:hypothetical protein
MALKQRPNLCHGSSIHSHPQILVSNMSYRNATVTAHRVTVTHSTVHRSNTEKISFRCFVTYLS